MAIITSNGTGGGLSNDIATWVNGVVPVEGDKVIIAATDTVIVTGTHIWGDDSVTTTLPNAAVNVYGTLKASRIANSSLTSKGLILNSNTALFDWGVVGDPIPNAFTAELVLNKYTTAAVRTGLGCVAQTHISQTCPLRFHGQSNRIRWTLLAATAATGQATFTLNRTDHGWLPADRVMFFATGIPTGGGEASEILTIQSVNGAVITLSTNLGFTHAVGSPACNMSSNVTVRAFDSAWASQISSMANSTLATAGDQGIKFYDTAFDSLASVDGIYLNLPYLNVPYKHIVKDCAFDSKVFRTNTANVLSHTGLSTVEFDNNVLATPLFGYGGGTGDFTNCVFTKDLITSSQNCTQSSTFTDCWVTGKYSSVGMLSNGTFTRCTISSPQIQYLSLGSVTYSKFINCDIGYTFGIGTLYGNGVTGLNVGQLGEFNAIFEDCMITPIMQSGGQLSSMWQQKDYYQISYININKDPLQQRIENNKGVITRNASAFRSPSSMLLTPHNFTGNLNRPLRRVVKISATSGSRPVVVCYVKMDSAFYNAGVCTLPTISLSGLGISKVVVTATSVANNAWEKLVITPTTDTTSVGYMELVFSAILQTVSGGGVYFSGVPDSPFVDSCRHYGFTFDEANPARTVNTLIQATEAVAIAYTGIAVTDTSLTVSGHTWQEVYDYSQAYAAANINSRVIIESKDGSNFTVPTDVAITWSNMPSVGTLVGGHLRLPVSGTYTVNLSGTTIDFISPGTYFLSQGSFSGTITLVNSSGGAVVVDLPTGATIVNAGPNISYVPISCSLTFTNVVIGSRVHISDQANIVTHFDAIASASSITATVPIYGDARDSWRIKVRKASEPAPFYRPFTTLYTAAAGTDSIYIKQELS